MVFPTQPADRNSPQKVPISDSSSSKMSNGRTYKKKGIISLFEILKGIFFSKKARAPSKTHAAASGIGVHVGAGQAVEPKNLLDEFVFTERKFWDQMHFSQKFWGIYCRYNPKDHEAQRIRDNIIELKNASAELDRELVCFLTIMSGICKEYCREHPENKTVETINKASPPMKSSEVVQLLCADVDDLKNKFVSQFNVILSKPFFNKYSEAILQVSNAQQKMGQGKKAPLTIALNTKNRKFKNELEELEVELKQKYKSNHEFSSLYTQYLHPILVTQRLPRVAMLLKDLEKKWSLGNIELSSKVTSELQKIDSAIGETDSKINREIKAFGKKHKNKEISDADAYLIYLKEKRAKASQKPKGLRKIVRTKSRQNKIQENITKIDRKIVVCENIIKRQQSAGN